jgi:hypothetical protein
MSVPFPIRFEGGQTATAVRVDQPSDLPAALAALGLHAPRLVVVLVGGAGLMDARDLVRLQPLFERPRASTRWRPSAWRSPSRPQVTWSSPTVAS